MTNPAARAVANPVSQDPVGASVGVFTERFDVSQLPVGPAEAGNSQFNDTGIFSPQAADRGESPASVDPMPPIDVAAPVAETNTEVAAAPGRGRGGRRSKVINSELTVGDLPKSLTTRNGTRRAFSRSWTAC